VACHDKSGWTMRKKALIINVPMSNEVLLEMSNSQNLRTIEIVALAFRPI